MQMPRIIKSGFRCCIGRSPDQVLDSQDNTVMHMAAMAGELETIRKLINRGARINITNKFGQTPLHLAAMDNHSAVVRLLLQAGADVGAQDNEGRTPLHYAAGNGSVASAEALLYFGACPHRQDGAGQTAVFGLYRTMNFEDVQTLLSRNDHYRLVAMNGLQGKDAE